MKSIRKIDVVQQNPRNQKLRVAAYCRVSTKFEGQKTSIELQKEYYTQLIENNPDWQNAGVFVGYGSRCRTKGRPAFCEMIHKTMNGETPNNYKYFYGFHVENGELKINEEEAVVSNRNDCL